MVTVTCEWCGKTFQRYPSQIRGKRQYCSRKCHHADPLSYKEAATKLRKRVPIKCANCEQVLMRHPTRIRRGTKHHFCDRACKANWQRKNLIGGNNPNWIGHTIIPCDNCGVTLDLAPWEFERGAHHFCCQECRGVWLSKNCSGQDASNWQGGISFEPYSSDFNKRLREQIRERDDYTCQLCGLPQDEHLLKYNKKLCVHHINYDKKDARPCNLIALCIPCHVKTNSQRESYEALLTGHNECIAPP